LTIYCATGNAGKLKEFQLAAKKAGIEVALQPRFSEIPECVEDGANFAENAALKALHYGRHVDGRLFADDSSNLSPYQITPTQSPFLYIFFFPSNERAEPQFLRPFCRRGRSSWGQQRRWLPAELYPHSYSAEKWKEDFDHLAGFAQGV
jgi:hypothetical protein